eukprot:2816462-Alexandrium_andersonii.AAC.1
MSGVAYHLCPKSVALNIMGHSRLDGELKGIPMGLLREATAESSNVGEEGGCQSNAHPAYACSSLGQALRCVGLGTRASHPPRAALSARVHGGQPSAAQAAPCEAS